MIHRRSRASARSLGLFLLLAGALLDGPAAGRLPAPQEGEGAPLVRPPTLVPPPETGAAGAQPPAPLALSPERRAALLPVLARLEASEHLRGGLNRRLGLLDAALSNLEVPDQDARALFGDQVFVRELRLQQGLQTQDRLPYERTDSFSWWVQGDDEAGVRARDDVKLFVGYLANVKYVDEGTFRLVGGDFAEGDPGTWKGTGVLRILAHHTSGRNHQVLAHFSMTWKLDPGADASAPESWRISSFDLHDFGVYEADILPFSDYTERAIPDADVLAGLQKAPGGDGTGLFHPALAVTDVNGDGFDDLFVASGAGKARLLLADGQAGFVESAAQLGLDVDGASSAAVFADLDNDGDPDALLGRGDQPVVLLVNDGGHFVDRTAELLPDAPRGVVSAAAVDDDRDGLLDLYLCTASNGATDQPAGRDPVRDRVGPPNVLLRNVGGRFQAVDSALSVRRDTAQAAFADFDGDGDLDVYLANDFAPDALYRNDAGTFVDVTAQYGIDMPGPSRGATWADYDKDGDLDLYVSGIDSPAARGLAKELGPELADFGRMFRGNTLLEQRDGGFLVVSASSGFGKYVDQGGASWGGLFVDLDDDRWLDLVSAAGVRTAEAPLEEHGDDLEAETWVPMLRAMIDPGSTGAGLGAFAGGDGERSFLGHQRPHAWIDEVGRRYHQVGYVLQVAQPGDGRAIVPIDVDRDGFPDLAIVSRDEPMLRILRNEIGRSMQRMKSRPRAIALRFVGGDHEAKPASGWSNRDGIGARVITEVDQQHLVRDQVPFEGFGVQSSSTMLVGIGVKRAADKITVQWPSGIVQEAAFPPMNSLVTVYENPADSPTGQAFDVAHYPVRSERAERVRATIGVHLDLDLPEVCPYNLVITMNTHDEHVRDRFRHFAHIRESIPKAALSMQGISTDLSETKDDLHSWAATFLPPFPVLEDVPEDQRAALAGHVLNAFGEQLVPAVVVLDDKGTVLRTFRDVPTLSHLRQVMDHDEEGPGQDQSRNDAPPGKTRKKK